MKKGRFGSINLEGAWALSQSDRDSGLLTGVSNSWSSPKMAAIKEGWPSIHHVQFPRYRNRTKKGKENVESFLVEMNYGAVMARRD